MSANLPPANFARLPKWAQTYILSLERTIENQTKKIEELTSEFPDSNVKVPGWHTFPDRTLPTNSQVDFYLGSSRRRHDDMISVRRASGRKALEFHGSSGLINLAPVSGNVIRVWIGDY